MAVFIPRTTAPETDNAFYIHNTYGGLNECLLINYETGSVMPNCVGYAWGRAYELLGYRPKLVRTDARTWYSSYEGYARGRVPMLGAVACWAGSYYGHVAIVEGYGSDYIVVSESGWNEFYWKLSKLPLRPDGTYWTSAGQRGFQGFIYLPATWEAVAVDDAEHILKSTYETVDDIARAIIRGTGEWYKCYGRARKIKVRSYGFDYDTVQKRVNEILKGY